MRYTLIIMNHSGSVYTTTSTATYNFNPEYNKLTSISGPESWMLDLIKQKDGVYLLSSSKAPMNENLFLVIPESHPLFNASRLQYIRAVEPVYNQRISDFLKSVSERMVRELLNNQEI